MSFNEDKYRDNQLNKHLEQQEQNETVSECCGAEAEERIDCDECSECGECCRTITRGEYACDEYQSAMEDRADAQRDLERDYD